MVFRGPWSWVRGLRRSGVGRRGATLLEVLAAVAVLAVVLATVASVLGDWAGWRRRHAGARTCREVVSAVRESAETPARVCGPARTVVRGACRADVRPHDDCRGLEVGLRTGGLPEVVAGLTAVR